jgi:hypothetical protein
MQAASSLYEHPDFSDASSERSVCTVISGALTLAIVFGVAVYRLTTCEKPWDIRYAALLHVFGTAVQPISATISQQLYHNPIELVI